MPVSLPVGYLTFLGDSLIQRWMCEGRDIWNSKFAQLGAANHGSAGDSTQNLLDKLNKNKVPLDNVKIIVLMIGSSDLKFRLKEKAVCDQIKKITNHLQEKLPGVKILLMGLIPRGDADVSTPMKNLNAMLSEWENGFTIRYLDLYSAFTDAVSEKIKPDLYGRDKINLSTKGYTAWAELMIPLLDTVV